MRSTSPRVVRLYHGTDVDSAKDLEADLRLDPALAAERHIDGELGFYLATAEADAEFFAARRGLGRVLVFHLSHHALEELETAGAERQPVPGGRPPYFEGAEIFVPVDLFALFNKLAEEGEIGVGTWPHG